VVGDREVVHIKVRLPQRKFVILVRSHLIYPIGLAFPPKLSLRVALPRKHNSLTHGNYSPP
jgi:hypothetical protein